jgi:hypothetical protein
VDYRPNNGIGMSNLIPAESSRFPLKEISVKKKDIKYKTSGYTMFDSNVVADQNALVSQDTSGHEVSTIQNIVRRQSDNIPQKNIVTSQVGNESISTQILEEEQPVLDLPIYRQVLKPPKPTLYTLQEWEGYVVEITEDSFTARLVDITAGGELPDEEADFPISDLSEHDFKLLKPGAVFRWVIGYEKSRTGNKKRFSQLVFRDLPQWTKQELEEIEAHAKTIVSSIKWK